MNRAERNDDLSPKTLRNQKLFVMLPILVLPFLTLLLWTFGIVGKAEARTQSVPVRTGLNLSLPSAAPANDSNWNKMKYYEQADKDSVKLRSYLKSDPFRKLDLEKKEAADASDFLLFQREDEAVLTNRVGYSHYPETKRDNNEEKVYKKLASLNRELERMDEQEQPEIVARIASGRDSDAIDPDVKRLETMMENMQSETAENKELNQVSQVLDKILRIQNPAGNLLEDSLQELSVKSKRQVFTVQAPEEDIISTLGYSKVDNDSTGKYLKDTIAIEETDMATTNRFYSLEDAETRVPTARAIAAMVHEDQTLVTGGTVKLLILEEMYIGGVRIPKDQFIFGAAMLNGERLHIKISSIAYDNYLLPVSLTVFDKDGIEGIQVPGAITRDVAKRSAAQSVQGLGTLNSLDPSLGAQMATAGLQAAQNLLSKSAKLTRVHLRSGYQVLLKDDNGDKK